MAKFRKNRLIARLERKEKEEFNKAYDLYIDPIYRFIYFKVGNKEEAEDLTSSVFLKIWNIIQANSISNLKTLKPLIYKVARTTIIDHYRKKRHGYNITIDDKQNPIEVVDVKQDLHKQIEISSDLKIIETKILELKDEYREIIIFRYIDELAISEIAEIMDKSKGNVRVLVHRALKALRDLFEEDHSK